MKKLMYSLFAAFVVWGSVANAQVLVPYSAPVVVQYVPVVPVVYQPVQQVQVVPVVPVYQPVQYVPFVPVIQQVHIYENRPCCWWLSPWRRYNY